jgi:predicted pyridoxine 5'-phosphate oxidase superfamily flavin-nucleotide-binding protein
MVKITKEMREIIDQTRVVALATASKVGELNVVPIAYKKVLSDDELLLMDIFMRKTEENMKANPKVAVSVWHTVSGVSEGYQFKGDARIETSGEAFDEGVKMVKVTEPGLNPKSAVIIKVNAIYIISPGPDAGKQVS